MSQKVILHLFGWDRKFVLPFRDFIHKHFNDDQHRFIIYGDVTEKNVPASPDTRVMPSVLKNFVGLTVAMNSAEKIIIHGLFNNHLFYILALQPWLLKKCCWVIWGGDLYIRKSPIKSLRWIKNEILRRFIIKRMSLITTTVPGDFDYAKKWYKVKCQYVQNLMYKSHLARRRTNEYIKKSDGINIQVGNSADPSNNHREIIDKLAKVNLMFTVYAPLSYGDPVYRDEIIDYGKLKLGDRFEPITDFMSFSQYNKYLATIDVAIFNHRRQQAMGNTIALLSLGKKVFIRDDVTPWEYFRGLGLNIYNSKDLREIDRMTDEELSVNVKKCSKYFTEAALISSWTEVFNKKWNS